ncbi:MAG TPA: hypothetical protein VM734_19360 [Kofleriaceae bacterium]|nr:hypothetical protein [Kofleriaceae bacterium]
MKLVAAALIVAAALFACGSRAAPRPVAELIEGQGAVEREHAAAWAAAPLAQPFFVGDAVRTGPSAWARLRLRGGGVLRMSADTVIRFAAGGVRLEIGEAAAEGQPIVIETEAGPAQIESGGRLRAATDKHGVRYEVVVGTAVITREDGPVRLGGGEGLVVAVGGAIVERIGAPPAPLPPPPVSEEPAAPATAPIVAVVTGRGVTAWGHGPGGGAPRKLAAGPAALTAGETVKLPRGATLVLSRGADQATLIGPAEVDVGGAGGPIATARTGSARVVARAGELALAVPGGVIVTRGGEAGVEVARASTRVRVERGEASLDGERGDAVARAGETGIITRDGAVEVRDPAPTTIDVAVPAGESAVIHDPGRRVAVKLGFGDACAGDAVLELADARGGFRDPRRIAGDGGAAFFAAPGVTRYRLRCADGKIARTGSLAVRNDTGAAPIVKTASRNPIDLDGRRYTITYQNRLPAVTARWPGAPGGATVLHVAGAHGERTFDGGATIDLAAGAIAEGSHTVWMTAGGRSSPRTILRIEFDNAAPTAQISSPPPRAPWSDTVPVAGVTVEGWTVAVDGVAVPKDGAGRFKADVAADGKAAFAIRLAHPQHGVHYYVRRRQP